MLPVAILAGGLATRLHPITETIPKALVEVAGRPFLYHQLEWLREEGVRKVVLCVGHLGTQIQDLMGDGGALGLTLDYSFDGDSLLGTGGALRKATGKLGSEFFVLYGDSYLTCSLMDVQRAYFESGQPALMTVFRNDGRWDKSNVLFHDGRVLRYDKRKPSPRMQHIDYGLIISSANLFSAWRDGDVFDFGDLLTNLSERRQLAGYEVRQRFYEIGSPKGLEETDEFLRRAERQ